MIMKLKSRYFVGQLLAVALTFFLILWYMKDVNVKSVSRLRFQLKWADQPCISLLENIRPTANFTVNDILDRMRLSFVFNGLHAVDVTDKSRGDKPNNKDLKFKSPPREPLQIIVVPHSHNDPGWLKTYDGYFNEDTTHILTNTVDKLNQYRDMTFIWVETSFLRTWWMNQTQVTRSKFKDLVQRGQLEIVSGSFVAPDEASPHYFAIVDQMVEGHYWIKKNLDIFPETVLSFDQFGYSASMPYLWEQSGLKHTMIKRIHRGVKQLMGEKHWMTFNWRQIWDPEGLHDIMTLVDTYEWMSISDSCGPDRHICKALDFSVMPDLPYPNSPAARNQTILMDSRYNSVAQNLYDLAKQMVRQYRIKASNYKQNVLLVPHGGDFHYAKAEHWDRQYLNLKKFMRYVNSKTEFNVKMRFGTIKDYFDEVQVHQKSGMTFPTISGDFFTYTENDEYWTGYYTTRQFDKRLGREVLESLRAAELMTSVLFALFKNSKDISLGVRQREILGKLSQARENLGIFQHHDAITGTARAHVAADYEKRLSSAFTDTQQVLSEAIEYILRDGNNEESLFKVQPTLIRSNSTSLTQREPVEIQESNTPLILVNSLTQSRREIVSVTLSTGNVYLYDNTGKRVSFDSLKKTARGVDISFEVNFPPVSVLVYQVKLKSESGAAHLPEGTFVGRPVLEHESVVCDNVYLNVTFAGRTGTPTLLCDKVQDVCKELSLDWRFYLGRGGAYTMLSNGKEVQAQTDKPNVKITNSSTLCRVSAQYDYFRSIITLTRTTGISGKALQVDILDDLRKQRNSGDLAMRIVTDIQNGRTFFVDSNGFQLMGRKLRASLPFDGNVYPMTSMALIEDQSARLVVHSAQPHGVISPTSGMLDFMVDRVAPRPEMGMPEGVSDSKPTKTKFFIEIQFSGTFERSFTKETAVPSINSVFLNDILQHPIYKFWSSYAMNMSQLSHVFLPEALSCDMILANVKNLASDDNRPEGLSLTFHRRGISCSSSKDQFCPIHKTPYITPGQFLHPYTPSSVKHMSISHLYQYSEMGKSEQTSLKPMDVKTFWIQ